MHGSGDLIFESGRLLLQIRDLARPNAGFPANLDSSDLSHVFEKLNVSRRAEAAAFFARRRSQAF